MSAAAAAIDVAALLARLGTTPRRVTADSRLVRAGDAWRIRMKRVDLLDAGEPLPMIQLFP